MTPPAGPPPVDPIALLRTRSYLQLLVLAALIGVPVSVVAYGFLWVVSELQDALYTDLPKALGYDAAPTWWPMPVLAVGGVLVALAVQRLPGTGGHSPADGFKASGAVPPVQLPGIALAALATLSFGAVLGPEAPLIAVGSGLGVLAVRLAARDAPPNAAMVIAASGSFASISALVGSPLIGAFLLLEASGLGGATATVVLIPGLLAAGIGTLVFVGLDDITGLGTFSLTLPGVPAFDRPTVAMFGWALVFGVLAPFLGLGIQRLAQALRPTVERRMLLMVPLVGVAVGALATVFEAATDHPASDVLFSG
jgi:H+/Cl- antiporter ClcA